MGYIKKQTLLHVQHYLSQFNLSEDSVDKEAQGSNKQINMKRQLDNNNDTSLLSNSESYVISNNEDKIVNRINPK